MQGDPLAFKSRSGSSIDKALWQSFHLATLRREARQVLTGAQWQQARQIKERCDRARHNENRLYANRYLSRVATVVKRLIDEAGSTAMRLMPRMIATDRFDGEAMLRRAHREVRSNHQRRLSLIDRQETAALEKLMDKSARENRPHHEKHKEFNRVSELQPRRSPRRSRQL